MSSSLNIYNRRTFLRSGAAFLGLPFLSSMCHEKENKTENHPKRIILITRNLGFHAPYLFPDTTGSKYESTRYLKYLEEHRNNFTLFSGLSHAGYHSHKCEKGLLTGAPWKQIEHPKLTKNTISLDQLVTKYISKKTRYSNLVLGKTEGQMSWTEKGIPVPPEKSPANLYRQLFINGSPSRVAREIRRLEHGKSILDNMKEQLKSISSVLGYEDKDRIELLCTSIREAERSLLRTKEWSQTPKPLIKFELPSVIPGTDYLEDNQKLWYKLVALALQTDSTRVIQLSLNEVGNAKINGFKGTSHHDVSHHGKDPDKIEQLALIEQAELKQFNFFLRDLKQFELSGKSLFDDTVILLASNLGNASAHTSKNLPIILAGGGFNHLGYRAYDSSNNLPLSNLYVRILNQLNINENKFGGSTDTIIDI